MAGDYISVREVRDSTDLDRVSPDDIAKLAAMPVSQLDVLRLQLEVNEAFAAFTDIVMGALEQLTPHREETR
jgi:3-dehydroquinate dehydratase